MNFRIVNLNNLNQRGYEIIEQCLDELTLARLKDELKILSQSDSFAKKAGAVYGVRNLLNVLPAIKDFAKGETVKAIAAAAIGENAKIVRAIFFDKNAAANWKVPWHQDLTIAVREKRETFGFSAWTRKAGNWHVQPPVQILERMITLRFHLDDADETNGALKIIAGSHCAGRLNADQIKQCRRANEMTLCRVKAGDCLIMRPLILHASSAGSNPKHRRVIHLEFANEELPNNLKWNDS